MMPSGYLRSQKFIVFQRDEGWIMNHCECSAYKERNNHFWLLFTIPSSTEVYMLRADRSPAFNENNTATCNNGTYQY